VRFLADMGVAVRAAEWLRRAGHDVVHLRDEGPHRLPDTEVFAKAARERRILVTFDLDFGEIVAVSGDRNVSVVLLRLHDTRTAHVIERLAKVLDHGGKALEAGAVVVVEESRHRVRRLPLRR